MKTFLSLLAFALIASTLPAQTEPRNEATATPASLPPSRDDETDKPLGALVPAPDDKVVLQVRPRESIIRSDALLKVNVTYQGYAPHIPWQKESPGGRRGLGVILAGNRILVTAQMVADATYIELELAEGGQKIPAKVLGVDYEANLALIGAATNAERATAFFTGLKPMSIEPKAEVGENLNIWQLGRVGDLIVTQLRLGKVLTSQYVVEGSRFLIYEGQGIVRSEGNSFTVPIVKGGKLAGLLLNYDSKNQLTTVLPGVIIEHFLKDMEDGKIEGFPSLGIEFQSTLDEQFRDYLGLKPGQGGMFVSAVSKGGSADAIGVKKNDIVLAINGHKIDSRGDYDDHDFGRLSMSHIVRGKAFVGDKVEMVVLRDGKELTLKGNLTRKLPEANLVLPYLFDRGPNYVVAGGLVFQELTRPYLSAFGDRGGAALARLSWVASHPEEYEEAGKRKLVFLSAVLPTPGTQGYERISWLIVTKVNGKDINDLKDLDAALKEPQGAIHTFEFEDVPKKIFLDALQMQKDNLNLLGGAYRIGELRRIE
jgi:S1-C subfamily serine protease